jgi:Fe2+ or Zn2+ uptake regulation protein
VPGDPQPLVEQLQRRCRELGIPLTVQRSAIYAALAARSDHPTADQVYADLRTRLPGISKATAYRTLDKLVELGLVVRVSHPGSAARYDAKTHRHHHVVCDGCGAMTDLEAPDLDRLTIPDLTSRGFAARDFSVHVRGICHACRKQEARRPGNSNGAAAARSAKTPRRTGTPRRK